MGITLYADYLSQPCRAVAIFLDINKIPFEKKRVDLIFKVTRGPQYTALNPFQTVPALDEDNFFLIESEAIIKYIAGKKEVAKHWYPTIPRQRAKVDEYIAWQHSGVRAKSVAMTQATYSSLQSKATPDQAAIAEAKEALEKELKKIEDYFLHDKPYLAGGDITIADIMCSQEVNHIGLVLFDLEEKFPKIAAYMKRVEERLNPFFDKYSKTVTTFAAKMIGKGKPNTTESKNIVDTPSQVEKLNTSNGPTEDPVIKEDETVAQRCSTVEKEATKEATTNPSECVVTNQDTSQDKKINESTISNSEVTPEDVKPSDGPISEPDEPVATVYENVTLPESREIPQEAVEVEGQAAGDEVGSNNKTGSEVMAIESNDTEEMGPKTPGDSPRPDDEDDRNESDNDEKREPETDAATEVVLSDDQPEAEYVNIAAVNEAGKETANN